MYPSEKKNDLKMEFTDSYFMLFYKKERYMPLKLEI